MQYGFDDMALGALPAAWQSAETGGQGTPGRWVVEASTEPGSRILRLVELRNFGGTFNLLFAPGEHPADVALSVRLRADAGREDRGGGLVWRAKDANNYYVTRWNPLEKNLRLYRVVDAKRTQLGSVDLEAPPDQWHELSVEACGAKLRVSFDGRQQIEAEDTAFPGGGRVGLWTKADAASSFDDFRIDQQP